MHTFIKNLIKKDITLRITPQTKRYMLDRLKKEIKTNNVLMYGLRGVGKTILMRQCATENSIYFSADNIGFQEHSLYNVVSHIIEHEKRDLFFIDEIQTYSRWTAEIKNLIDEYDSVRFVLAGSSAAKLKQTGTDLSRRIKPMEIKPLFLHEFVSFKTGIKPDLFTLEKLLNHPIKCAAEIESKFPHIFELCQEYIRLGGLPIYFSNFDVSPLVVNMLKRVIYFDIPEIISVNYSTLKKLDKIILYLANSAPGTFSYEKISRAASLSKGSTYELIHALTETGTISLLQAYSSKAIVEIRKKPKIYFSHPTLRHSLLSAAGDSENIGFYREEFIYHHLQEMCNKIGYPPQKTAQNPDFKIKQEKQEYIFEMGKHRKAKNDAINIVDSSDSKYPMYLFGFLEKSLRK